MSATSASRRTISSRSISARTRCPDLVPGALTPVWFGFSVFATLLAYRTDKFGDNGPNNWADFWNVEKFPGRRGLYKGVAGMLESALMADGVPAANCIRSTSIVPSGCSTRSSRT